MKVMVCVASGPSLSMEDCTALQSSGIESIAVNSSWRAVPFSMAICAGDGDWWDRNAGEIPAGMRKFCFIPAVARRHSLEYFRGITPAPHNSGQRAIELAYTLGARRIILLGYDCSLQAGIHWHGPHEGMRNPTATSIAGWKREFLKTRLALHDADIINCSRHTELGCFRRASLQEVL